MAIMVAMPTRLSPRREKSVAPFGTANVGTIALNAAARGLPLNRDRRRAPSPPPMRGTWLPKREWAFGSTVLRCGLQVTGGSAMNKTDTPTPQGDVWSWIVIGLVFCAVAVALYGPFIWELTHSV